MFRIMHCDKNTLSARLAGVSRAYAHTQADELQGIWYYRVLAWSPISMGMGKVTKGAGGQNGDFKAVPFKRLFLT